MKTVIFALLLVFAGVQPAAAVPIQICEAVFFEDKVTLWCRTVNDIVEDGEVLTDSQATELLDYLDEGTKLKINIKTDREK